MTKRHSLLVTGLTGLIAFSCSRAPVKPDASPLPDSPSTGITATPVSSLGPPVTVAGPAGLTLMSSQPSLVARPLTATGENSDARFSPDGSRILFVSRSRPHHKQAQIYELHLGRMTEKRVTFHDGDDSSPVYTPDGAKILFASSTDEIKEGQFAIDRLMKLYSPDALEKRAQSPAAGTEIYEQTLHGRTIERLTTSPGFDGDIDINPKTKDIVFSSARSAPESRLYLLRGRTAKPLGDAKVIDRGPRYSNDGSRLVWSRLKIGPVNSARLIVTGDKLRHPKVLVDIPGLNVQPSWHPSGSEVIFSSNMAGKNFNLFTAEADGSCLRRLTNAEFDQQQPSFSPDGKKVLFTISREGRQNIYVMDYVRPADCWQPPGAKPAPDPTSVAQPPPPSG